MSAHAFLAPSSAARWVQCPLAPSLEAKYPESAEQPAALEGTAAHWVVQQHLLNAPATLGQQAPNGVAVTQEMLDAAELVATDIQNALGMEWRQRLFIEQPVLINRVHRDNWGTPDYYAWVRLKNGRIVLFVWDFKYGHGIVEVFENWQLIDYVAGILDQMREANDMELVVDMRVIQPRAYHRDGPVRSWRVVASDLRGHFNRLEMAAEDATGKDPHANPAPEACENCRGRHACNALQRKAYLAADRAKHYGATDLDSHALGLELRTLSNAAALLQARVSGLEAEVEARIKAGQLVPFWMLESSAGRLAWTKPASEVIAVGQMMGVNLAAPQDVITPTQAKNLGLDESVVNLYAKRPSGTAKLKYDNGAKARLIFSSSKT